MTVAWEFIPFSSLSRQRFNPIKPVYDPDRPDGLLNLTASAFNQLGQYTCSSPGRRGYCYAELAVFAEAELAWVAGYVVRQFTSPKAVTHPTTKTNRAQCRATALIETNALPLY